MNINMANLRYLNLFGRSNITGNFSSNKISNGVKIPNTKNSKNNSDCSISISEESKAMLEQLNKEKKQSELDEGTEKGRIQNAETVLFNVNFIMRLDFIKNLQLY